MAKDSIHSVVSEAEARKRWCRYIRYPWAMATGAMAVNRPHCSIKDHIPDEFLCIASRCMSWETVHIDTDSGEDIKFGFCNAKGE